MRVPIGLERLGLAAAAIQRQHPLPVQPLTQWLLGNQRLELADHLAVPTRGEVALDRQLDRRQPQLLESADLRGRERLVGQVRQRGAAPQRERLTRLAVRDEPLEPPRVDVIGVEPQLVSAPARDDLRAATGGRQHLAQLRHVVLHHLVGARRMPVAPEGVDQAVARHRRVDVQREHGQQRPLLGRAQRDTGGPRRGPRPGPAG